MSSIDHSTRTTPRQSPDRVCHEFKQAAAILDEGMVAHVGFSVDAQPYVIPMAYSRSGKRLFLHAAQVSRLAKNLSSGIEVCITVTHLDGMVLARSTFGHSMNYRSVMIFGQAKPITDPQEKDQALRQLVEFLVPGRNADARQADEKELNATALLAIDIKDFSVKQRSGPPQDPAKDMHIDIWTGEIPLKQIAQPPIPDPLMKSQHAIPEYAINLLKNRSNANNKKPRR